MVLFIFTGGLQKAKFFATIPRVEMFKSAVAWVSQEPNLVAAPGHGGGFFSLSGWLLKAWKKAWNKAGLDFLAPALNL